MALVEVVRYVNGINFTFQEDEEVAKELGLKVVVPSALAVEQVAAELKAEPKKAGKK